MFEILSALLCEYPILMYKKCRCVKSHQRETHYVDYLLQRCQRGMETVKMNSEVARFVIYCRIVVFEDANINWIDPGERSFASRTGKGVNLTAVIFTDILRQA